MAQGPLSNDENQAVRSGDVAATVTAAAGEAEGRSDATIGNVNAAEGRTDGRPGTAGSIGDEDAPQMQMPQLPVGRERADSGLEDVIAMVQAMRAEGFSVEGSGKREEEEEEERRGEERLENPRADTDAASCIDYQQFHHPHQDMDGGSPYYTITGPPHDHDGMYDVAPQIARMPLSRGTSVNGSLFEDFDGVHYSPDVHQPPEVPFPPPGTQIQPPHRPYPTQFAPPPGLPPGARFYPAPVPAVLNLPPLLSKPRNASNGSAPERRTMLYQGPGTANAPNPGPATIDVTARRRSVADVSSKRLSAMPASLRASAFFESMAPQSVAVLPKVDVQQAGGSAMRTLDMILDASATAPPAAFTDHPITGLPAAARTSVMAGGRSSMFLAPQGRGSVHMGRDVTVTHHPGETPRSGSLVSSGQPQYDEAGNPVQNTKRESDGDDEEEDEESDEKEMFDPQAVPTTLLAELAQRKVQQKSRTRTAASAFPTGMHSTLLELDAVAQVQAATRRRGRPVLAWEDPGETNTGAEDDEDVPLGMLFPKGTLAEQQKDEPRGLIMKKELEDHEPLAKRKERLQAERKRFTINVDIPHVAADEGVDDDDDDAENPEEETLAQRRERLKRQQLQHRGPSTTSLPTTTTSTSNPAAAPEEEETLAQRRRRLQMAKDDPSVRRPQNRKSLIMDEAVREQRVRDNILAVNSGHGVAPGGMLGMGGAQPPMGSRPGSVLGPVPPYPQNMGPLTPQMQHQLMMQQQMGMQQTLLQQQQQQHQMQHHQMMLLSQQQQQQMGYAMGPMGMGMGMGMGGAMLQQEAQMNQKQREFVERWRTSIM